MANRTLSLGLRYEFNVKLKVEHYFELEICHFLPQQQQKRYFIHCCPFILTVVIFIIIIIAEKRVRLDCGESDNRKQTEGQWSHCGPTLTSHQP